MIVLFMKNLNYTLKEVLELSAVSFYSMYTTLQRVKASEDMNVISRNNPNEDYIHNLKLRANGINKILEEVRLIKRLRK